MLTQLKLTNFKNHQETTIQFGRLTALVGPNGAGKSSILQSLYSLKSLILQSRLDAMFKNDLRFERIVRYGCENFSITAEGGKAINSWTVQFGSIYHSTNGDSEWHSEANWKGIEGSGILQHPDRKSIRSFVDPNPGLIHVDGANVPQPFFQSFGNITYLKFDSNRLAEPSHVEDVAPVLRPDGYGLPSVISHLKVYEDERFAALTSALQAIVPNIERIRVRRVSVPKTEEKTIKVDDQHIRYQEGRDVIGDEMVFDITGAKGIPGSAMSDGTLLVVSILAAIYHPSQPQIVLIDDVEQGLHPKAQRELITQLRAILASKPELQIVLTTHSPYIVDELDAEEVYMLATDKQGHAHAKRLSDHPDADEALQVLTTGEFWSAEGEEWVVSDAR